MIRSFVFSEGRLVGQDLELEALRLVRADRGLMLWVDLEAPAHEEVKSILEGVFAFHPLAIEDCVTPSSLPKIEDYEDYLFIAAIAMEAPHDGELRSTELDLFLGRDFLVTYHGAPLKCIQTLLDRCNRSTGVVARGPDRLAHDVLDILVDNYQPVMNQLRTSLEELEFRALATTSPDIITTLLDVRGRLSTMRQIIRPLRDVINRLAHGNLRCVRTLMLPYFRDLRDNLVRLEESLSSGSDRLLVVFDLYLNKSTSEVNEGIKVLTALAAITLPPIVVGSWYGMNFKHMPELDSPWAYPAVIIVTVITTIAMYIWCRIRRWI